MKLRPPEAISSKRLKLPVPKPSKRLRSRGPLRLSHSKGSMATSCGTWRNKSSERKAEVKPTSSLPVRSPCTPAHQSLQVLWLLPTTFYWANTSVTSTHPPTEGFTCGRTAHFHCFFHTSAQAVS